MKQIPMKMIAISIMIICFLNISYVVALEQNEASVTLAWSSQTIYQGSIVNVIVTFHNNAADEIEIEQVGLHFDWMAEDYFAGRDFSTSPIAVPAGGSHTFEAITITVSNDTSVGEHSYYVGVDGSDSFGLFVWDSPEYTVDIISSGRKTFQDLLVTIQKKLAQAINTTYESPEAQSLLQEAKDAYTLANLEAGEGNYQDAIQTLEALSSYLDQAEVAEKQYAEQMVQQQQLLLVVAVILVVFVVVVIIVLVWRRWRKMKPKVKRVSLKEALTISGVKFSGGDTIDIVVENSGSKDFGIAEVWINNEKQAFTTLPSIKRLTPNESVHVYLNYAYSKGTNYDVKFVSDRKKAYLVSATAL